MKIPKNPKELVDELIENNQSFEYKTKSKPSGIEKYFGDGNDTSISFKGEKQDVTYYFSGDTLTSIVTLEANLTNNQETATLEKRTVQVFNPKGEMTYQRVTDDERYSMVTDEHGVTRKESVVDYDLKKSLLRSDFLKNKFKGLDISSILNKRPS